MRRALRMRRYYVGPNVISLWRLMVVAAVPFSACSAEARVPRSPAELPQGQHVIEGMAGTNVVSPPLSVPCHDDPTLIVGVRFKVSAKRLPYARALILDPAGGVLRARRFKNSGGWQFASLRLSRGCGVLHAVDYSFHRPGDRAGQRLGSWVCVLGPKGERCPVPTEGE